MSRFSSADKRIRIKIERPGSLEGNSPHKRRLNLPTQEIEGWSAQDAFRELYQFWKDAIAESFSLIGGFTQTYEESAGSVTVKATLKGIPGYLGFIEYSKVTKRVSLVVADYHLLSTEAGTTVEVNNRDSTIAGLFKFRNERIKLAALSLCKDGCKFSINSRDRYWVFELEGSGSLLMCKTACMRESAVGEIERRTKSISTLRSRQSKDVSIFINSDTTLIYMGMFRHWLTVALDICDFSLPSETITTVYGDILLDRKFSGKVFLQGVLLPETKLGRGKFTYGYNLQHATVSGNRRSFSSPQEEAMRLCRIWEAAIAQKAANALQKYVFLLTDRCGPLDISDAQNHLSASTVKAIWAYLRHMDGGKNFYHANIPSDTSSRPVPDKTLVDIPDSLWYLLRKHKIILTIGEELERLSPVIPTSEGVISKSKSSSTPERDNREGRSREVTTETLSHDIIPDLNNWEAEEFWPAFNRCNPQTSWHLALPNYPLSVLHCKRLKFRFEKGDSLRVTVRSPRSDEVTSYIFYVHRIFPATQEAGDNEDEGMLLVTQYLFFRQTQYFFLNEMMEKDPQLDEKELLLLFNNMDCMGGYFDGSLIQIHTITAVSVLKEDTLGPTGKIQHTSDIPKDLDKAGLFCRFALACNCPEGNASIMPVDSCLMILNSKQWPKPRYNTASRPMVFDLSPSIVGLAEGFSLAGCEIKAAIGFDPVLNMTWKAAYRTASVFDGSLDTILQRINAQELLGPTRPEHTPSVVICSIVTKNATLETEEMRRRLQPLEQLYNIFSLQQNIDFVLVTLPQWAFHEHAFSALFRFIYNLLTRRFCVHLKHIDFPGQAIPRHEGVVILLASSLCSPVPWPRNFSQSSGLESSKGSVWDLIKNLSFANAGGPQNKQAFACTGPGLTSNVYNHYTGSLITGQSSELSPTISMANARHIQHPERHDMLTVRELARIQGFDDDFIFWGDVERQYKEVTQAFPPVIARDLASMILRMIEQYRCDDSEDSDDVERERKRRKVE